MFDHVPHPANPTFLYSDVGVTRPYTQLAAPAATNSSWVQELFDPHYRWSEIYHGSSEPQPKSAGLIGNLSIILGLVAFSRPKGQLPAVLNNNVRRGRWIPHQLPHGRTFYPYIFNFLYTQFSQLDLKFFCPALLTGSKAYNIVAS
jgi:hypothetical protein